MNAAMVASGARNFNHKAHHACERSERLAKIDKALVKLPSGVAEAFIACEVEGQIHPFRRRAIGVVRGHYLGACSPCPQSAANTSGSVRRSRTMCGSGISLGRVKG